MVYQRNGSSCKDDDEINRQAAKRSRVKLRERQTLACSINNQSVERPLSTKNSIFQSI